jgi:hypothetical protein
MTDEQLLRRIQLSVKDGRLTCADAHAIAEETGATLARIGKLCDGATPRIKISACQLGCF